MLELLGNYWVGLLILGPIAGVLWALIFRGYQPTQSASSDIAIADNSGQVVTGDNNVSKQIKDSFNQKIVNNHHHGNKPEGDDPVTFGFLMMGGMFLVGVLLVWGFAKYGHIFVSLELAFVSAVSVLFVSHLLSGYMKGQYSTREAPVTVVLMLLVGINILSLVQLNGNLRSDVTDMVNSYQNVVEFFFALNTYGKCLLITQVVSAIIILLSQCLLVFRVYKLADGQISWMPEGLIILPIFGLFPLWLSESSWCVEFILAMLP